MQTEGSTYYRADASAAGSEQQGKKRKSTGEESDTAEPKPRPKANCKVKGKAKAAPKADSAEPAPVEEATQDGEEEEEDLPWGLFAAARPARVPGGGSPHHADAQRHVDARRAYGPFHCQGNLDIRTARRNSRSYGLQRRNPRKGAMGARMLTLCGPCDKLQAAHKMALEKIALNGDEGGRAPEPQNPPPQPPQRAWRRGSWDDSWKQMDWPTRDEVNDLQRRWQAPEQQCSNNAWRIQVLEGWYWWCNQNENGNPYAAASTVPNPANSKPRPARSKGDRKNPREASPVSDVTKSPREYSQASEAPTIMPTEGV
eukprot:s3895_g9.t1